MNYEPKIKMKTELRGASEIPPPDFAREMAPSNFAAKTSSAGLTLAQILVPIDFSAASDAALRVAIRLAREHHGQVVLLHVVEPFYGRGFLESSARMRLQATQERNALRKLREHVERYLPSGVRFECMVEQGNPQYKILTTAQAVRPDLIVIGRSKRGPLRRAIFGGVSTDVLDEALCPVLLINDSRRPARV